MSRNGSFKANGNGVCGNGGKNDVLVLGHLGASESLLTKNGQNGQNGHKNGIKIEKMAQFTREADVVYLEEDCLSATARKCRITPKRGLIYLITSSLIISALVIFILYLLATGNTADDRNRPFNPLLGGGGNCSGPSEKEIAAQLISRGHNMTLELMERFRAEKDWDFKQTTPEGDKGFIHKKGNVYRVTGTLPQNPEDIIKILYDDFETSHEWNKDVGVCKTLKKLDKQTEIGFQKTKAVGPVSSRDFITLRQYRPLSGTDEYVLAYESVEWPEDAIPNDPEHPVRGYFGVSGWHLRSSDDDFDKTDFQFLIDVNLKMPWIPFWDSLMVNGACDTVKYLRKKLSGTEEVEDDKSEALKETSNSKEESS